MIYEKTTVLIPIKAFSKAKQRLSKTLNPSLRHILAIAMAEKVIESVGDLDLKIVADDQEVIQWTKQHNLDLIISPFENLNKSLQFAFDQLASTKTTQIVVVSSDLPLAKNLSEIQFKTGVNIIPDKDLKGTNLLSIPLGKSFKFEYGPNSFRLHCLQAKNMNLGPNIIRNKNFELDIDTPKDLDQIINCPPWDFLLKNK